ncbi:hypothetical protein ACI48D_05005 [Massilia sp. LXY-6]|uniref:hypothetical protein n=1 Tax=Massilia sp. LXY-6 TaxID=3379823 RepID=UPI003EE017E1
MPCVPGRSFFAAALPPLLLLAWNIAGAAVLECPANAPPEWKAGHARLDRVRMSAYLPGSRFGSKALPEGAPDKEWQLGGTLFQSWDLKKGPRAMSYQVDCMYMGISRVVRFDPRSAARCIAKRPVRRDALMLGALEFRCR